MNYLRFKVAAPTVLLLTVFLIFGRASLIQAQGCIQPAPNLSSWWKGEADTLDVYGHTNGTLKNGTTFADGYNGRAFSFDGTDDTILLGYSPWLNPASITVEAWIKKDGVPPNGIENILAKWGFDANLDSFLFGVVNDGGTVRAFCAIGDGATGDGGLSGGVIPLNTWTHVAMTYNASDGLNKLYVNGAEVASRVRANGIFVSNTQGLIGNEASTAPRFFKGLIDEPAFYDRALSAAEIQAIYNAGPAGRCKPSGLYSTGVGFASGDSSVNMGYSTAINGNILVIAFPGFRETPSGPRTGMVAVFEYGSGTRNLVAILLPGDGTSGDEFGHSVAISDDKTIVVGAPWKSSPATSSGAAYVFTYSGGNWNTRQKITAGDGAVTDHFGQSVAVSNDTVVIGAYGVDLPGQPNAGAAYIFNKSGGTWTQSQKFLPTGTALGGDTLGHSVAIGGSTIAAGAPGDDTMIGANMGTVYVYARSGGTWTEQQKLTAGGAPESLIGTSVAIDGNTIVAGAPGTPATNSTTGAIHIFVNNGGTWSRQGGFFPSYGALNDSFGTSVAISGDTIAVGSPNNDASAGEDSGSVYIYKRSDIGSVEKQKLNPSDGGALDRFGTSVSLSRNKTLSVGAPYLNDLNGGGVYTFNPPPNSPFDFDGDGKTDISIFRPNAGEWWYLKSSSGGNYAAQFGASTDKLAPADFTGDGKSDIAFWRPSTGFWFVLRSEDFSFYSFPFGQNGDVPAPADYDGDGKTDAAVFRPSTATWYVGKSSGGTLIQTFGQTGDVPVVADYDGDAMADIAIYRVSSGQWWIQRSSLGGIAFQFGNSTDKPVQGDYTGDGKADVAFFRPSSGEWFVLRSENQSYYSFPFGISTDIPAPGDYDGDGKFDATVFRPSNTTWFSQRTAAGTLIQAFGIAGDKPVPNAFVP